MATIQQALALYDGVSPVLHQIGRAVDQTIGKFTRTAGAATNMEKAAAQGAQGVANAVTGVSAPISNLGTKVDVVSAKMRNVGGGTFNGVTNAVNTTLGPIRKLGSAIDEIRAKLQGTRAGNGAFSGMQNASRVGANGIKSSVNSCNRSLLGLGSIIDMIKNKLRSAGNGAFGGVKSSVNSCNQAMMGFGSTIDVINNKLRNAGNGAFGGLKNALSGLSAGLLGPIALGNVLANGISMLADKIASIPSKMIEASDEYTSIQGRLRIVAGSAEKAAQMNELIYQSAVRARGSYTDMARSVAEIAMNAKDAFPKPEDAIPFMEGIQKIFAINQTGIEQQKAAMLQLTQALASGRLQGDEFRSIAEAAPMIETMIAKTMGVSRGALKDLAKEGEITAEIIKQAIFENMDEIDEMFLMAPMTWGQRLQVIGTIADHAFNPIKEKLNDLANSDFVKKISLGAVNAADLVARAVMGIMNNIEWGFSVIQNNWGYIEPILMGLAIALLGIAANSAIAAAGEMAMAAASSLNAINSAIMTAQFIAETLAVEGLNAALYACPLTWIIGLVVLAVGAFYLAIAAVNHFAGTSISATGLIFGAFAWLVTSIINYFKVFGNFIIAFANFLGAVWADPLGAAYNLFVDIWNAIADYVAQAVNSIIDMIKQIPGMDKVLGDVGHVESPMLARKMIMGAKWRIDNLEYGNAYENAKAAYDFGANGLDFSLPEYERPELPEAGDYTGEPKEGKAAKDTADNTGRMANAMEIQEEDLKYLRDMAEQEAINRYTTAEVKIEMGGINNNISNSMDLDGVMDYMTTSLIESMQAGAEEVHPV